MGSVIYQMDWNFEENPDLESAFCIAALQHLLKLGFEDGFI
jgi:hypothetical protein